jgi:hypothetical protein
MHLSVFLSFSSTDAALAIGLRESLQQRGIRVWKAPESISPGVEWAQAIHAGIAEQQVFLLLWSDAAMASAEVTKEITLAACQHRRLLLPVRLTSAMPDGAQAYHLAGTQWLEGQGLWVDELADLIEDRLRELVKTGGHVSTKPSPLRSPWPNVRRRKALQGMAACLGCTALAFDLNPWLVPNQWILNQRLFWQARWRQATHQLGPKPEPIGVVPLNSRLYEEFEIAPTDRSVNQAILAAVLRAVPEQAGQSIGLDFILDGPGTNPAGHQSLATVIKQQSAQRQVYAGLCPPNAQSGPDCLKAIDQRLASPLAAAGAKAVSLSLGMSTKDLPPLELLEGLGDGTLALAMAKAAPKGAMPSGAIVDWSVNWLGQERLVLLRSRRAIEAYQGKRLLVSSDGYKGLDLKQPTDQHPAPAAIWAYQNQGVQSLATLQSGALPGSAIQAVLAQSIRSGHWLEPMVPFVQSVTSLLLGLLGWWGGCLELKRRRLLFIGVAGVLVYGLVAFQLVVSMQRVVPLLIPIATAGVMMGMRRTIRKRS